jgi:hypothetical protein
MKKYYTPITNKLSYIEYTGKEIEAIQALIEKVEDKELRLRLTKKLGLCQAKKN